MDQKFVKDMLSIGVVSYKEQETLYDIAKRCAKTMGIPTAGAGMVFGVSMGTVLVPGVGSLPGTVVGALAGLVGGTVSCTMLNSSVRGELKKLARGE